ncbi:Sec1 family domain-containing protein 2 [Nymphon striatum]|nr:Sec1 family domain-containing protein 2 [Nymphon striatum]
MSKVNKATVYLDISAATCSNWFWENGEQGLSAFLSAGATNVKEFSSDVQGGRPDDKKCIFIINESLTGKTLNFIRSIVQSSNYEHCILITPFSAAFHKFANSQSDTHAIDENESFRFLEHCIQMWMGSMSSTVEILQIPVSFVPFTSSFFVTPIISNLYPKYISSCLRSELTAKGEFTSNIGSWSNIGPNSGEMLEIMKILGNLNESELIYDKDYFYSKGVKPFFSISSVLLDLFHHPAAAQQVANKSVNDIDSLKDRLEELKKKFTENDRDVKIASKESVLADKLAQKSQQDTTSLEDKYDEASQALEDKAKSSGDAKKRADELREGANKLAQNAQGKLTDLQTLEGEYDVQERKLMDLSDELAELNRRMDEYIPSVQFSSVQFSSVQFSSSLDDNETDFFSLKNVEKSGIKMLCEILNSILESLDIREDVYTVGKFSRLTARHLDNLNVTKNRRKPSRRLCSSSSLLLHRSYYRLKSYGHRSFSVSAPELWNALSASIRNSSSLSSFKTQLKAYLGSLLLVDRSLDIPSAVTNSTDCLMDRIMRVLPKMPAQLEYDAVVDMSCLADSKSSRPGHSVVPGTYSQVSTETCRNIIETSIFNKPKLFVKNSIEIDKGILKPSKDSSDKLKKLINLFRGHKSSIQRHLGLLQQALAMTQTMQNVNNVKMDKLSSIEKLLVQSINDSETVVLELVHLMRTRHEK